MFGFEQMLGDVQAPIQQTAPQPNAAPAPAPQMADVLQPQAAPPVQAVQAPQAPPDPQRVSGWKRVLEAMQDPMIQQPLLTFFNTMAMPMQPGETFGARIGRAAQVMQVHKQMLEENLKNEPLLEREKAAKIAGLEAETRSQVAHARVAEGTADADIEKASLTVDNLKRSGELTEEQIARYRRENELDAEFGRGDRLLDQQAKRAQIQRENRLGSGNTQPVTQDDLKKAAALINSTREAYLASKAGVASVDPMTKATVPGVGFNEWVYKNLGAAESAKLMEAIATLQANGGKVKWDTTGKSAFDKSAEPPATGASAPRKKGGWKMNSHGVLIQD